MILDNTAGKGIYAGSKDSGQMAQTPVSQELRSAPKEIAASSTTRQ
jgi:hypothetical protein